jgi:SAM-dependent methyltransferase
MRTEQFEAHARLEGRHWWFTARRSILLSVIGAVSREGSPIADVGCGTGGNAAEFAEAGYTVMGIDPSEAAIALACDRFPKIRFLTTDDPITIKDHLEPDGTVVLTDVLEHVVDDRELLERVIAVVPRGGHLVLTVPAHPDLWSSHDEAFGHQRRYTEESFRSLWAGSPVEERLYSFYNSRLFPIIRRYRLRQSVGVASGGGDLDVPVGPLNSALRAIFRSESRRLVADIDSGRTPFNDGVSLIALLRRT